MEKQQTAAEWIEDWLKDFPSDEELVERMRQQGKADESIKAFLEIL